MVTAGLALGDDRAVKHVEGGEQRGGAVAPVVVGDAFDVADPLRDGTLGLMIETARLVQQDRPYGLPRGLSEDAE